MVDALTGTREPAFDHAKAAAALGKAKGRAINSQALPIDEIERSEDGATVIFWSEGRPWRYDVKRRK